MSVDAGAGGGAKGGTDNVRSFVTFFALMASLNRHSEGHSEPQILIDFSLLKNTSAQPLHHAFAMMRQSYFLWTNSRRKQPIIQESFFSVDAKI